MGPPYVAPNHAGEPTRMWHVPGTSGKVTIIELPNYQITKLPNYQITKLPNYRLNLRAPNIPAKQISNINIKFDNASTLAIVSTSVKSLFVMDTTAPVVQFHIMVEVYIFEPVRFSPLYVSIVPVIIVCAGALNPGIQKSGLPKKYELNKPGPLLPGGHVYPENPGTPEAKIENVAEVLASKVKFAFKPTRVAPLQLFINPEFAPIILTNDVLAEIAIT
jgi:hypothetical protein